VLARLRHRSGMVLTAYALAWGPVASVIGRSDPQTAHTRTVAVMRRADRSDALISLARVVSRAVVPDHPIRVGGVTLPHPIILAAGLIKGDGFAAQSAALAAVRGGRNIVPGWRSVPALVGAVELGSFTRHPRLGNPGRVLWRTSSIGSMQNRVGLRNPGALAAAEHLRSRSSSLPPTWGVNLAPSPGVDDVARAADEIAEAASAFERAFQGLAHRPSWYTLNLSCPNTDDDPHGRQSGALALRLGSALRETVSAPVWAKVGPDLSDDQLRQLVAAFADCGIRAVIATNTVARPSPDGGALAGVSGAALRPMALDTVARLHEIITGQAAGLDIVGCGGILDGADLRAFRAAGARAAMIYSALVFRGPLAAALILHEAGGDHDA